MPTGRYRGGDPLLTLLAKTLLMNLKTWNWDLSTRLPSDGRCGYLARLLGQLHTPQFYKNASLKFNLRFYIMCKTFCIYIYLPCFRPNFFTTLVIFYLIVIVHTLKRFDSECPPIYHYYTFILQELYFSAL